MYLRLQFSSIGRSDNIQKIRLCYIEWDCDALTVRFLTTKADQTGERTNERKHIYCSTNKPHDCSVLAFALYIWYVVV